MSKPTSNSPSTSQVSPNNSNKPEPNKVVDQQLAEENPTQILSAEYAGSLSEQAQHAVQEIAQSVEEITEHEVALKDLDVDEKKKKEEADELLQDLAEAPVEELNSEGGMLLAENTAAPAATGSDASAAEAGAGGGVADTVGAAVAGLPVAPLIGLGALAAAGGGGGSAAAAAVTTLNAMLSAGEFTLTDDGNGGFSEVTFTAYSQDGTEIEGTVSLNADGSIKFEADSAITGPILLVVSDNNGNAANYTNEATNSAVDMVGDLRIILPSANVGGDTVAITPLTELATRVMIGDAGGDDGSSSVSFAEVSVADISASNTLIAQTFGLTDITKAAITLDDADFATSTDADAQAYGQVLAALSGAESTTGLSTNDLLNSFAGAISSEGVDQSVVDAMEAGADKITNDGNFASFDATALKAKLATLTGSVTNVEISAPVAASDYVTGTAAQTITATLENALNNTLLWGSVDGGTTWTDISDQIDADDPTGKTVEWIGVNLAEGANKIKLAVTDQYEADGVTAHTDFDAAFAATDGAKITTQTFTLDTTDPVFAADDNPAAVDVAENTLLAYSAIATDAGKMTYSLGGTDAALFAIKGSRVVFKAKPNYESAADDGTDNVYNISITATDFAGNSATHAVAITVTDVNEAPSFDSGATASFAENTDAATVVYDANATDQDSDTLTYSLSGTDKALFNIDSSTGEITFKESPNFESAKDSGGDNVYNVTVTATDDDDTSPLSTTQDVAITVTDVNEKPSVTSKATASINEKSDDSETEITDVVVYTATASDEDGDDITFALGGTDAASFDLDATSGELTFKASPDHETKDSYSVTITANDGTVDSDAQTVTVSVNDVNEAPTSTSVDDKPAVVSRDYTYDVSAKFDDVDDGDTLTYSATGLPTGLTINASTGVISGTAPASTDKYEVTVTAKDSGGLSTSQKFNVDVVEKPVITAISSDKTEVQSGAAIVLTATVSESVTIAGGTPTLTFNVDGNDMVATYDSGSGSNTLIFNATATAGSSDLITVTSISLGGATITGDVSGLDFETTAVGQEISNLAIDNDAPTFTSAATASFAENATGIVISPEVTDVTDVNITFDGADAALFKLTNDGLSFIASPNYEAPADAGGDNVYNVTLTAKDAFDQTTTQDVAITVTNVNEAPSVSSSALTEIAAAKGVATSLDITSYVNDVDANDSLTFTATGLPAGLTLSEAGIVSGTPTQLSTSGTSVTITATDAGGETISHTMTVYVLDPPTISSSLDGVTNFDVTSHIVLTANTVGDVKKYTEKNGVIKIVNDGGDGFNGENTVNTLEIDVNSDAVSVSGNLITIELPNHLDFNNDYHIEISAGAFYDADTDLDTVAITDSTSINFSTVNPGTLTAAADSVMMSDAADSTEASFKWIEAEFNGSTSSGNSVSVDVSDGEYALVATDYGDASGITSENFLINVNNFADGDVIYWDNRGDNSLDNSSNFDQGLFYDDGSVLVNFGSPANGSSGQFNITPASSYSGTEITTVAQFKAFLGSDYEPISYG